MDFKPILQLSIYLFGGSPGSRLSNGFRFLVMFIRRELFFLSTCSFQPLPRSLTNCIITWSQILFSLCYFSLCLCFFSRLSVLIHTYIYFFPSLNLSCFISYCSCLSFICAILAWRSFWHSKPRWFTLFAYMYSCFSILFLCYSLLFLLPYVLSYHFVGQGCAICYCCGEVAELHHILYYCYFHYRWSANRICVLPFALEYEIQYSLFISQYIALHKYLIIKQISMSFSKSLADMVRGLYKSFIGAYLFDSAFISCRTLWLPFF